MKPPSQQLIAYKRIISYVRGKHKVNSVNSIESLFVGANLQENFCPEGEENLLSVAVDNAFIGNQSAKDVLNQLLIKFDRH